MNKRNSAKVATLCILCLFGIARESAACSTMPLELRRYAEKTGTREIPDFFGNELGYHLPAFSYGLLGGEFSESAAMLVAKGSSEFQILTVRRKRQVGKPAKFIEVFPPLNLDHNPMGLRIEKRKFKTLKNFVHLGSAQKSSQAKIPQDTPMIVCEYDGEQECYVFVAGAWWGHFLND